jgi:hypothetical protein
MPDEKVVWVVESGAYSDRFVVGVYSSPEAAKEANPLDDGPCWQWRRSQREGHETHKWEGDEEGGYPHFYNWCLSVEITPYVLDKNKGGE